jgi:RND family efflux transporter MFP subunit
MKKIKAIITWFKHDKKRLVVLGILLVGLGLSGRRLIATKTNQPQYQTAKAEKGTLISSVSASGQILTANIVNITSNAKGLIKEVSVKDGDSVKSGQKIMEISLDPEAEQRAAAAYASYLSAKNSLDSAEVSLYTLQSDMLTKWKTYMELVEDSAYKNSDGTPNYEKRNLPEFITVQNDWLAAEAKYKNQQNVIAQSKINLNNSWLSYQKTTPIVTAPMAGTITNITYSAGMTISGTEESSQRVAVIKASGNPLVSFNVSEIDVSKVKPGQKATVKLDSLTDKTFTGKVMTVDRIGSVTSGVTNYPVVILLDTQSEDILPNMSATATIILETKDNVLLIPSGAIQQSQGQSVVRVLKDGQMESIVVETGLSSDTKTEILSGLEEGDEVVTSLSSFTETQTGRSVFSGLGGAGGMMIRR